MVITTSFGWSIDIHAAQFDVGLAEARRPGITHHSLWRALVRAGVPVRDERGKPFATLAATAIVDSICVAAGC